MTTRRRTVRSTLVALLICTALSCVTRFSPDTIRDEIFLQQGRDPLGVFELNLGRFTTLLIKNALAAEDGELPFAGLSQMQLAVYESPSDGGPVIDVTRIALRGWEPMIRTHDASRSAMVLIRPNGDRVGDLVVVGAGRNKVVYARLQGTLSPDLPSMLGDALRRGGPDEIRRVLTELAE